MRNIKGGSSVEKKGRSKGKCRRFVLPLYIVVGVLSFLTTGNIFANEFIIYGDHADPPKYYLEKRKPKGFIVEITQWVLDEIEQKYQIKLLPWARAYNYALEGKGGIIGLSKNSERLKVFDYSEPLYFADKMVVVKKGNEFPFKTILDLRGKLVAVPRASSYGDEYDKAVKDKVFNIQEVGGIIQGLKMLKAERVDAALIGPGIQGLKVKVDKDEGLEMDQFSLLPVPLLRDAKYLGIPKSLAMREFLKKFNNALKKGWDTGELQKIVDKYYQD